MDAHSLAQEELNEEMQQHFCASSDFPEYSAAEEEAMIHKEYVLASNSLGNVALGTRASFPIQMTALPRAQAQISQEKTVIEGKMTLILP
ncbi:Hypothetical protein PHPALM_1469 [Phytophthora palmivora]|uniref:Uncharacterized protein n=1 Tax=Phytophthora palmivora TaxID=4796 RepID=A0A2P4YSA0_9STRA|nr:Hypothetical protein PHPALM_1469 [Phytophthora palmivora]